MNIRELKGQGHSVRAIARLTGHSRNTVRATLRQPAPSPYQRKARASILDPFKAYLKGRFGDCDLSAVRLLEEIQPMGYSGSLDVVQDFLRTLRPSKRALETATVRFETAPGQQAQVDWAHCGRFAGLTGREVPIYAFVMVLGFSRAMYVEFTTSMALPVLLRCHMEAFAYFGGWPQSILYDNMKQVRIGPNTWNELFLDFANHYGFTPKTHRIRRPRTKGKVERMVHYVKDNFLNGRAFADLADLNAQGRHWLEHTANARVHSTTGRVPAQMFAEEKLTAAASIQPYQIPQTSVRTVDRESFVHLAGSRYSVPPAHVGAKVDVLAYDEKIVVRSKDLIIAEHPRAAKAGLCIADEKHMSELWKLAMPPGLSAPMPQWRLTFTDSIAVRPLSTYEEAAA